MRAALKQNCFQYAIELPRADYFPEGLKALYVLASMSGVGSANICLSPTDFL